jgi:hypothetical protein
MSRFIIADLTEASSIPKELEAIIPHLAVPVKPIIEGSERPYSMFSDYGIYDWVLDVYRYDDIGSLVTSLPDNVIAPAERKVTDLIAKRRPTIS